MPKNVEHQPQRSRFRIKLSKNSSEEGVLLYEKLEENKYEFYHTEVPTDFRGQGFGAQLARSAFDFIVKEKATVVISCSYLRRFADENLTQTEFEYVEC